MAGGVSIPIAADASSVIAEAGKAGTALEDVIDSLDGVAQASETDADRIGRSLDQTADDARQAGDEIGSRIGDGTKDAADAGDKLERKMRDSLDAVRTASKRAGDDIGEDVSRGAREASEGTEALSENAGANAKEVAASFDGSAQSIADGFQGLAAEAFEGFGPAGLAAGVVAAAGIGLVMSSFQKAKEEAQATAEAVAQITGQLIDLGSLSLDNATVVDNLKEAASSAEDGKVKIQEWAQTAREAGVDFTTYARGLAGDTQSLNTAYASVSEQLRALGTSYDAAVKSSGGYTDATGAWLAVHGDQFNALKQAREELLKQDGTLDQATETTKLYNEASAGLTETTDDQTAATEAARKAQEQYASTLDASADPVSTYNDVLADKQKAEQDAADKTAAAQDKSAKAVKTSVESQKVSVGDLIREWNNQAKHAEQFEDNLAEIASNGGQALADELRAKGPEVAGAVAETIAQAGPAKQRAAIAAHARATGQQITDDIATGVSDSASTLGRAVTDTVNGVSVPKIKVGADTSLFDDAITRLTSKTYVVKMAPRNGRAVN